MKEIILKENDLEDSLKQILTLHDDEDKKSFYLRICRLRNDIGLTWQELVDGVNESNSWQLSANALRKQSTCWLKKPSVNKDLVFSSLMKERNQQVYEDSHQKELDELREKITELHKLKVAISDERVQNNAYIRQLSREDNLKQIAESVVKKLTTENPFSFNSSYIIPSENKK